MAVSGEAAPAKKSATATAQSRKNGHQGATSDQNGAVDLALILASLQTMRKGDFSVRLPVAWTGIQGKIADTFNVIHDARNEHASLVVVIKTDGKAAYVALDLHPHIGDHALRSLGHQLREAKRSDRLNSGRSQHNFAKNQQTVCMVYL